MKELMNLRSDDVASKREMVNKIIQNNEASIPRRKGMGKTRQVLNTFMVGLGLNTSNTP